MSTAIRAPRRSRSRLPSNGAGDAATETASPSPRRTNFARVSRRGVRLDGVASSVTARLAAPSSRLARRTPRQETDYVPGRPPGRRCFVGHSPPGCSLLAPCQTNASSGNRLRPGAPAWTALLRRSQPAWLLPPRALPDERLVRKPITSRGARLDGVASSVTARLVGAHVRAPRRGAGRRAPASVRVGFGAKPRLKKTNASSGNR